MSPDNAYVAREYAAREFQRFLNITKIPNMKILKITIKEMRKTAQARGLSKAEMSAIIDADELLEIYHATLARLMVTH